MEDEVGTVQVRHDFHTKKAGADMTKSPFHTDANYERLAAMIQPMAAVEEFVAAFPRCVDSQVADQYSLERVWDEVQDMQVIPRDTSDGILGHVCEICGGMKFGVRPILGANLVRLCPACLEKVCVFSACHTLERTYQARIRRSVGHCKERVPRPDIQ